MLPTRRDYHYELSAARIRDWNANGREATQFFNALSIFFPVGERFFISSVRHFRTAARDPELQKAITAFIGQEAMHGREHEGFNRLLADSGLPAEGLERGVGAFLSELQRLSPKLWQLSVTIALEHFTAVYADKLLSERRWLDDAEPEIGKLWLWHSVEETEHKAVAFDLWKSALADRPLSEYALRSAGMVVTGVVFTAFIAILTVGLMEADLEGLSLRRRWAHYRRLGGLLWGRKGFLRQSAGPLLQYFKPDFHPWQEASAGLLARKAEVAPARSTVGLRRAA